MKRNGRERWKKFWYADFFTLLFALFLFPAFLSYASESSTKQVLIGLEAVTEDRDFFRPNEQAHYELTLRNKLGPSWIRVKFELFEKDIEPEFTEANLNIQDGWVKRGDYFYYTKKAEPDTDYLVVDGLKLPGMANGRSSASVTVNVYGEAIPYDCIVPDFSGETPWENEKPQHTVKASGKTPRSRNKGSQLYVYSVPKENGGISKGYWELVDGENHIWKYHDGVGNYARDGWIYVHNPYAPEGGQYDWFHFGTDGVMTFGWYKADAYTWYYCHGISDGNLGRLVKGWHTDGQDGKRYFLDRKTGIMLSGWQEIDGDWYYFATYEEIPQQTWFFQTFGETGIGRWVYSCLGYRSYGSLYVDEKTPDGCLVDQDGRKKIETTN